MPKPWLATMVVDTPVDIVVAEELFAPDESVKTKAVVTVAMTPIVRARSAYVLSGMSAVLASKSAYHIYLHPSLRNTSLKNAVAIHAF